MKGFLPVLLATSVCASGQTVLFSDSFERPDSRNLDASLDGIIDGTGSSLVADGVYLQPYVDPANETGGPDGVASNGGGSQILSGELELADGAGTSNAYINHNFTNAEILAAGGFAVEVTVGDYSSTARQFGGGFALGMSQVEADSAGDAFNLTDPSMTGAYHGDPYGVTGQPVAPGNIVSDFWIGLRGNDSLAWGSSTGNVLGIGAGGLTAKTGTIRVEFSVPDFDAGTTVDYEVFLDGFALGTGSFQWSGTGENFIGLDARDGSGVFFDDLSITTLPPQVSLAVSPPTVSPDNPAKTVTLDWTAEGLPAGATYSVGADQAVTFPSGGETGSAAGGSGSLTAIVDGTLGDTTFTIDFLDGPTVVASADSTVRVERPNVILIMTDDMGFSDFGCYGSEIQTPTIDTLAQNGIRYRNFYNTARCSTTRCALLSGLYTHQVGDPPGASLPPLRDDNNVTIAELLISTGYRRYMTGKWHTGTSASRSPIGRGFQHIFGQTSGGSFPHNQVSGGNHASFWNTANFGYYSENDEIPEIDYGTEYPGTPFHQTTFIGEYALRFLDHHIDQDDGAPFFLYMPFNAVHWDINAPAEMADRYTDVGDPTPDGLTANGGLDGGDFYQYEVGWDQTRADRFARQEALGVRDPSWVLSPKSPAINSNGTSSPFPPLTDIPAWNAVDGGDARRADLARRMALYAAMLQMVDESIQKVVDKLDTEGLLDNTLIFIIADNGGNYEGGLYGKTDGTQNAAPVTGFTNLRNMGQASNPDLHVGGGWANVNNTPFRLYKHYQHEGGIRSPCIVHWPDGISSPGRWVEDRGHLIDIMATISDVTATPYPATFTDPDNANVRTLLPLEGESLLPHFDPATIGDFPERPLGFEHESNRAWFKGDYKFVTKNFGWDFGGTIGYSGQDELELYDVTVDPTELDNLALSQTELLSEMVDEWNAWADHVGVPSDRLLVPVGPQTDPAPLPTDLFVDHFGRANDGDHDASADGMSGSLLPLLGAGATYWDSFEGGSTEISNFGLRMAAGSGMTETAIRHNFTDPEILSAGGFSVQVRIDHIASDTSDSSNRYAGIAVGLSAAEAQASADVGSNSAPFSFRGNGTTPGTADFVVDLDIDGNVKCWSNGTLLDTTPVGQNTGTLLVCYETASFDAGAAVTVSAFLDGRLVDLDTGGAATSRSFTWETAGTNHIGLTCRAASYVSLDNLAIRTLPLSGSLASNFALDAGLSGNDAAGDADPDGDGDDNFTEWLKNGDPTVSDVGKKLLALSPSPSGEFRFSYVHLNEADKAGLTYTFRYSPDLAGDPTTWPGFTPDPISTDPLGDTHELRLVGVPSALVSGNPRLFILVEVE